LNRSLAQSAAVQLTDIFRDGKNHTFRVTFLLLSKFGFLSHNFGSRNARMLIKLSKDKDYTVVSNKLEPTKWLIGWSPGTGKLGQKGKNLPLL